MEMINWIKERCPVCSRIFEYPKGGYKPKTCSSFTCVQEYHHHPDKYISLQEHLDNSRKKAGI